MKCVVYGKVATTVIRRVFNYLFDRSYLLFAIFLAGLLLRLLGTNPGYLNHPDEPKIADAALNITFSLNFEPIAFYYGSLLPIVYALFNFIFILPIYLLFHVGSFGCFLKSGIQACLNPSSKEFFYYLTRYETAVLSSISIILIYYLGKKLFNKNVGLWAALFTAINYRHVLSSHFALADAPLTVFIVISIFLTLRVLNSPTAKNYFSAGVGVGLTLSVKYFIHTIPLLLVSYILSGWKNKSIVLALFGVILTFFILNPYLLLDPSGAKEQHELNAQFYGVSGFSFQNLFDFGRVPLFSLYYLFEYALGNYLSIIVILGIIVSLFRYTKQAFLLLSVVAPFMYFFLILSGTTFVRNYSAILPLLTIFAGIFVDQLIHTLKTRKIVSSSVLPLISVLIAFFLLYQPLMRAFAVSAGFSTTPNYKLLENWILDELPDNSKVEKTWGTPFPGRKQVELKEWTPYSTGYRSLSELTDSGTEWLILSTESGVYINHFLNIPEREDVIKASFVNSQPFWNFLEDNYASLLTRELANYRVKEFVKPSISLDPSFAVVEIPPEVQANLSVKRFEVGSDVKLNSSCFAFTPHTDEEQTNYWQIVPSILVDNPGLKPTKLIFGDVPVEDGFWYRVGVGISARGQVLYKNYRSKYVRLDFVSDKGDILKTYVSNQVKGDSEWEDLQAGGIAPQGALYARVVLQIDDCSRKPGSILVKTPVIQRSESKVEVDRNKYRYFDTEFSRDFIWMPPL